MLCEAIVYLTKGGEMGIFSPMHMVLCRKPSRSRWRLHQSEQGLPDLVAEVVPSRVRDSRLLNLGSSLLYIIIS
ncbi:24-methylenesterol C-methyltransferase 3 [Linum perenne]